MPRKPRSLTCSTRSAQREARLLHALRHVVSALHAVLLMSRAKLEIFVVGEPTPVPVRWRMEAQFHSSPVPQSWVGEWRGSQDEAAADAQKVVEALDARGLTCSGVPS